MDSSFEQLMVVGIFSGENSEGSTNVSGRETRLTAKTAADLATYYKAGQLVMVGLHANEMADWAMDHRPFLPVIPFSEEGEGDLIDDAHRLKMRRVLTTGTTELMVCTVDYRKKCTEFIFDRVFGEDFSISFRYPDTTSTAVGLGYDKDIKKAEEAYLRHAKRFFKGLSPDDDELRAQKLRNQEPVPRRRSLIRR